MTEIKKIQKLKRLLQPQITKVIITSSQDGCLGVSLRKEVFVNKNNELVLLEPTETSELSRNLTYSIWFEKELKILVEESNASGTIICATPQRAIISGHEFEKYYKKYSDKHDLTAVWIMKIKSISAIGEECDIINEKTHCPGIRHLDKLREINNE